MGKQSRRARNETIDAVAGALKTTFAILASVFCLTGPAIADPSRFTLASQDDWGAKHGFYVDFENDTAADGISKLSTLKLIAGVADGTNWRYIFDTPTWTLGHVYHAEMKVDYAQTQFYVDGTLVGQASSAFASQDADLEGSEIPGWANARTDYQVVELSLAIVDSAGRHSVAINQLPGAAVLFGGSSEVTLPKWRPGRLPFTVDVDFRLDPPVDPASYDPLVDRYGQPTFADYPGKIKSDADLVDAIAAEKRHEAGWSSAIPYDRFGGELHPRWRAASTGYYYVTKHNGFNWLIDPLGAPVFYNGICTVAIPSGEATPVTGRESIFAWLPDENGPFAPAVLTNEWGSDPGVKFASFVNANFIRKYGANWRDAATSVEKLRARLWGFSGLGKWSADWDDTPSIPVLGSYDVPNLVRHPDIFDPQVMARLKDDLAGQITPHLHSPDIVGWSFGNEYDEVITTDEIKQILQKPVDCPSRKALVDYAVANLYGGDASKAAQIDSASSEDLEKLRQFYADHFYAAIHDIVKGIDPHHLFMGWWLVPKWWQNESDWKLQAAHVDVLGIDYYANALDDPQVLGWIKNSPKPVLIGEYSFPSTYGLTRGFGRYAASSVDTPDQAGARYENWIRSTASNPNVLGDCWFEMCDEGIAGRGPGHGPEVVYGEHYAFGLVDVTDSPKWPLVDKVRDANLKAAAWREKASSAP